MPAIKILGLFCGTLFLLQVIHAQDTTQVKNKDKVEKIKAGWSFGAVPAIAYDTDIGFKYGGVVNLYHYGDGSHYPQYDHSIYLEWSRTTKGSGINQFIYDSEYLIPKVRLTVEASLLTEKALDFYGFNGYKAYYNNNFTDDTHPDYISRVYYKQERSLTRLKAEFVGKHIGDHVKWFSGVAYYGNKISSVDIDALNEGQDPKDRLPDTALLYDQYISWGIIPDDQVDGGSTTLLKFGLVYDTRDNEPNPMKGLWSDIQLIAAPSFLGNEYAYSRIALTHRQYFTLAPKILSLAYRLSYQGKIGGEMPYYMLPFVYNMPPYVTRDGLGGAKTIRGVLRNRVVGEDFVYGNIELRWKFYRNVILNQNVYLALATFLDGGQITGFYTPDKTGVPDAYKYLFPDVLEKLHMSYGVGLHVAINQNFILSADYGRAIDPRDGDSGFYIGLNFLF